MPGAGGDAGLEQSLERMRAATPEARVALYGGSFDPPHLGHVAVARAAADSFGLGTVIFMPTGLQPLKPGGASAGYGDRMAMAQIAALDDSRFAVSGLDAPREDGQANYTVDTLRALREAMPLVRMYAIAGADSFLELPRWRESAQLLLLAEWIVVSRPGFSLAELDGLRLPAEAVGRIQLLESVRVPISATELRARLGRGEDCSDAVPAGVMAYIREHGLYGCQR